MIKNSFCRSRSILKLLQDKNRRVYRALHCGSWQCANCGPWKKKQFLRALPRVAKEHGLHTFVTLTIAHDVCTPEESYAYAAQCFDSFRKGLLRRYGKAPRYVKVLEAQPQSGYAHYHMLINRTMDYRELSWRWSSVGGGRIVDIRPAHSNVARYVSKYFGKSLDDGAIPRGKRRYTTARDIHLIIKNESTGQWYMVQERIENLHYLYQDNIVSETERYDSEQQLLSFEVGTRAP